MSRGLILAVCLPKTLEQRLSELAELTHRSKSYYVKQAIQNFLNDHEVHLLALAHLEEKNSKLTL
ncbi:ribbon-helix-helix domain-containing protein [Legionella gresilensis]|uniref:ribbon-helix-helix domain-containing protein n=1 Tax=Legionella gresilensis TaxID=91823 RepID=UPI001F5F2748|nr:ribbon-helix-helix domain-containing protein [Legionella gresilensis]